MDFSFTLEKRFEFPTLDGVFQIIIEISLEWNMVVLQILIEVYLQFCIPLLFDFFR